MNIRDTRAQDTYDGIRRAILQSSEILARPFPWNTTRDPYKIWISEIILQQTRTQQGLPYYLNIIQKYPDIETLAQVEDQVFLKDWEGLGYYSRARNLLHTARVLVQKYNGVFPNTYQEILGLKGIGPYTAAAIASFAFGRPRPAVDGNVLRLFSRLFGIEDPIDRPATVHSIRQIVASTMGDADPAVFNRAVIDIGATICTPKNPDCTHCPLQMYCAALADGIVDVLPVKSKQMSKPLLLFNYFFILSPDGAFAMIQRDNTSFWKQMYEFPVLPEVAPPFKDLPQLIASVNKRWNLSISEFHCIGEARQTLSHRHLSARLIHLSPVPIDKWHKDWIAVDKTHLAKLPLPKLIRDLLKHIGKGQ